MKNKITCLLFSLSVTVAFADIRNAVCIVRPNYSEKTIAFMEDTSDQLKTAGYSDLADLFKDAKEGVFGSGFFIKGQNKKDYVLTNYHVAAYATSLTLEIETLTVKRQKSKTVKLLPLMKNWILPLLKFQAVKLIRI